MDIWQLDKLVLFIAFVILGFISIKVYTLFYPSEIKDSSKQLIDAIKYSCINYAVFLPLIFAIVNIQCFKDSSIIQYFFFFCILFVAPIIWVLIWKQIRESNLFQNEMPHPTQKSWDFVFSQRKPFWIIITLKSGVKIGGKYSDNSFTLSYPAAEQIYFEECWNINNYGGFERIRNDSEGIIVLGGKIQTVELFKYFTEVKNGRKNK